MCTTITQNEMLGAGLERRSLLSVLGCHGAGSSVELSGTRGAARDCRLKSRARTIVLAAPVPPFCAKRWGVLIVCQTAQGNNSTYRRGQTRSPLEKNGGGLTGVKPFTKTLRRIGDTTYTVLWDIYRRVERMCTGVQGGAHPIGLVLYPCSPIGIHYRRGKLEVP